VPHDPQGILHTICRDQAVFAVFQEFLLDPFNDSRYHSFSAAALEPDSNDSEVDDEDKFDEMMPQSLCHSFLKMAVLELLKNVYLSDKDKIAYDQCVQALSKIQDGALKDEQDESFFYNPELNEAVIKAAKNPNLYAIPSEIIVEAQHEPDRRKRADILLRGAPYFRADPPERDKNRWCMDGWRLDEADRCKLLDCTLVSEVDQDKLRRAEKVFDAFKRSIKDPLDVQLYEAFRRESQRHSFPAEMAGNICSLILMDAALRALLTAYYLLDDRAAGHRTSNQRRLIEGKLDDTVRHYVGSAALHVWKDALFWVKFPQITAKAISEVRHVPDCEARTRTLLLDIPYLTEEGKIWWRGWEDNDKLQECFSSKEDFASNCMRELVEYGSPAKLSSEDGTSQTSTNFRNGSDGESNGEPDDGGISEDGESSEYGEDRDFSDVEGRDAEDSEEGSEYSESSDVEGSENSEQSQGESSEYGEIEGRDVEGGVNVEQSKGEDSNDRLRRRASI
jgi:hypothetical protein